MTNSQFQMYAWIKLHIAMNSASLPNTCLRSKRESVYLTDGTIVVVFPQTWWWLQLLWPPCQRPLQSARWQHRGGKKNQQGGPLLRPACLLSFPPPTQHGPPALCRPIPKECRRQNFCCIFIAFPCSTYNSLAKLILFSQEPDDTSPTLSGYPHYCALRLNSQPKYCQNRKDNIQIRGAAPPWWG